MSDRPRFFCDLGSPYAWLTAERTDGRDAGMAEVEERARARGLPPVRWPEGWPGNYLHAMRVAAAADSREFALAAFRAQFTQGLSLSDPANVERAATQAGVAPEIDKDGLRANTDLALSLGVTGVPSVVVGDEVFWGDDRLEEAASALEQQLE